MHTAKELFERFNTLNVLIVGDVMIDRYISGSVHRISPEAPVPVVQHKYSEDRLGGAANVALNIRALGATPFLCSVVGADIDGETFIELLHPQGLSDAGIVHSTERITTVKTRVMAEAQHLLRIDQEMTQPLSPLETNDFIQAVHKVLNSYDIHVILLQDYNKGVLTPATIEHVITEAHKRGIPTAVDPKFHNFWAYTSATLFKPNLKEIRAQIAEPILPKLESLQHAADLIRSKLNNQYTMITLSEAGIFVEDGIHASLLPTHPRPIADVSGAGDTVISVVALGLALGLSPEKLGILGNLAGGQVCEHLGVVPVDKLRLLEEYEAYDQK